jgi:hypothetical protein
MLSDTFFLKSKTIAAVNFLLQKQFSPLFQVKPSGLFFLSIPSLKVLKCNPKSSLQRSFDCMGPLPSSSSFYKTLILILHLPIMSLLPSLHQLC